VGSEIVRGHSAYHLDCIPRADRRIKHGLGVLQVHVQPWIDQQDLAFVQVDEELMKKHDGMLPGTKASLNWMPFDGAWLPTVLAMSGQAELKRKMIRFDTKYSYSDYRRFRAEVRILDESANPLNPR
jgi:hypothetical protein